MINIYEVPRDLGVERLNKVFLSIGPFLVKSVNEIFYTSIIRNTVLGNIDQTEANKPCCNHHQKNSCVKSSIAKKQKTLRRKLSKNEYHKIRGVIIDG